MSILSELGKFLGEKFKTISNNIQENENKISSLENEIESLKVQIETLQNLTTPSTHSVDVDITNPNKGLILRDEYLIRHRLRINRENKLIIDIIDSNQTHVAEIHSIPSGSSSTPITWDG